MGLGFIGGWDAISGIAHIGYFVLFLPTKNQTRFVVTHISDVFFLFLYLFAPDLLSPTNFSD